MGLTGHIRWEPELSCRNAGGIDRFAIHRRTDLVEGASAKMGNRFCHDWNVDSVFQLQYKRL